jgi:hypothetical protein
MDVKEMKDEINSIMFSGVTYGLTVFALVKREENFALSKFLVNDDLRDDIEDIINSVVKNKFVADEIELDSANNISDNRKIFYEIIQDDTYAPFAFIDEYNNNPTVYSEKDQNLLVGLLFKINLNAKNIWFYQHIYQMRMIKRSKSLYAMITKGDTYIPLDRDIFKLDSRLDILIINNSLITSNISLLQQSFGFDKYIRSEAAKTIKTIESLDIVSDTSKILDFEDKPKLTNAKKLLKARNSPVLRMKKENLISGLRKHPRYKEKFKFDDNKIVINSQKDVNELVKMLNDDIVRSELTNQEYDSSNKHLLDPLND